MEINPEQLSPSIEKFIQEYMSELERDGIIIGLSGGIDSAVVSLLCKRAVGSEKILALIMPDRDSKKEHIEDAQKFADENGITTKLIDITPYLKKFGVYGHFPLHKFLFADFMRDKLVKRAYEYYERKTDENPFTASIRGLKDKDYKSLLAKGNAYYRIKHRIRMVLLYFYGELENRLVVGSANKSEYRIGFFVKHGCDDLADIMPIINLYKTQVRELARYLKVPNNIIEKPPSPDILPGINDEDAIGLSYEHLDLILLALELGWNNQKISDALGLDEKTVVYVRTLIERSEHMRNTYSCEV
ncbi:MAG: NAD(+) synthase [bacterium]